MKIRSYPDGTTYVELEISDRKTEPTTFKVNTYTDLWILGQFVEAYNNTFHEKPSILIPNLIDAQADKRDSGTKSYGLKRVINYLNELDVEMYHIFHPHNQQAVELGLKKVKIISNSEFIMSILIDDFDYGMYSIEEDNYVPAYKNLSLMSSDAGGFKSLMELCSSIAWGGETICASKSRSWSETDGTKFIQELVDEDYQGKDIMIVDDLSIYGGTFKGLSKLLRERNCGKLYLAVSHITVKNMGVDPVTNYFDKVYTTNSKFNYYTYEVMFDEVNRAMKRDKSPENLKVIKLFK